MNNIGVQIHKGAGRPSVLSEEKVLILITCLQNGLDDTVACQEAQIGRSTFYRYMKNYPEFRDKMIKAKNRVKILAGDRIISILEKGNDHDAGKIAMWVFEKKMPDLWGKKV